MYIDPAERTAAVRAIRQLVEFWQITPEELDAARPLLADDVELPPKYRHPVTGHSWDGRGPHPDWLREALLQQGYTVAELRAAATHLNG